MDFPETDLIDLRWLKYLTLCILSININIAIQIPVGPNLSGIPIVVQNIEWENNGFDLNIIQDLWLI